MIHHLFLLTADPRQEARIRAAAHRLGEDCAMDSGSVPPEHGGCELLLVDDRLCHLLPREAAPGAARRILLATAPAPVPEAFQPGVVDVIPSAAGKGQILLVLRQQLGILQLLRLRGRLEQDAGVTPERAAGRGAPLDINNPLTGILGNAELALASHGRIPPDVRHRLECVRNLAAQIRESMATGRRAA
ncbi:MAG: hypothetical protein ACRD2F_04160 [Terriglobales bacterium]